MKIKELYEFLKQLNEETGNQDNSEMVLYEDRIEITQQFNGWKSVIVIYEDGVEDYSKTIYGLAIEAMDNEEFSNSIQKIFEITDAESD